jgi:GNAT superfamily N-acetyltransferase
MRLRRATREDMPAVAVLHRLTMRASLAYLPELHTAEEDRWWFTTQLYPANAVWLAEDDAGLAGYAATAPGWLNHLYVHPDRQGAGVGPLLLAQAKDGAHELQLWTFQRNARARAFYEKRGFALVRLTDGAGNEEREPDALYRWTREPAQA